MDGKVYDVTSYIEDHPGGIAPLIANTNGKDASEVFNEIHSEKAKKKRETFCIGTLIN